MQSSPRVIRFGIRLQYVKGGYCHDPGRHFRLAGSDAPPPPESMPVAPPPLRDKPIDTTGQPAEPISSPGSTTAKLLPNAVNFGPNMPGDKYMGHTENEFKRLDVSGLDLQMFTEMMVRMSNLPSLQ